jgi:hypothetical protein
MEDLTKAPEVDEQQATIKPKGWNNVPALGDLTRDRTEADRSHERQKKRIKYWLDYLHVEGEAKIVTPKGSSEVQPRLIRKQAEWRYAALSEPFLAAEDMFDISPVTFEDVEAARQNKLVINHQINTKINKVKFVDDYIRACVDEGTAIIKVGWETREEDREIRVPVVRFTPNPQLAPLYEELNVMESQDPNSYRTQVPEELRMAHDQVKETGIPVEPRIVDMETKTISKVVRNAPTVEVCDYNNVVIDPSCMGDLDRANFIIYSFETSISELKKDGDKYSNLDEVRPDTASPLSLPDHDNTRDNDSDFNFADMARKRIVAFEYWGYWDYIGDGIARPIVATWVGKTLIRLEESPFPDGKLPFVVVPMLPVRNSVYGEPDGELLIENQKIIGAVTRGMVDLLGKSANGQQGYRKDALDSVNKRKFQRGQDYEYNSNVDPRMAFYMHTYPDIPVSAQYMLDLQNMDAESMTGVKAFSGGISSEGLGQVATGIRGALDAASKRETGILRRLAKGVADIGRKIVAMNQEFLEDEEIIRITNESFVAIDRDELAGDFDLRVDVSSLEEDNVKAQELAFMLQTMGNNMDPGMTKIILRDICRLRKMPELAKAIERYEPQPDPLEERRRQAEVTLLEAQVQKTLSEAAENNAEAQLDIAKANESQSKADLTNLDFIEQESGVKQERQKELHGEQARANQELEAFKSTLKHSEKMGEQLQKFMAGQK